MTYESPRARALRADQDSRASASGALLPHSQSPVRPKALLGADFREFSTSPQGLSVDARSIYGISCEPSK
jgi:hypothetical protein